MPPRDAFDILGLEPRFELDVAALERRVRELSRALHPDRHATAPSGQRRQALSEAISVNEAQRALKDPIRRGEILCRRLFGDVESINEVKAPPALLVEMMELREALAEARHQQDTTGITALKQRVLEREGGTLAELEQLFARGLQDEPVDRVTLEEKLGELRYTRRFLDEVAALEDEVS